MKKEEVKQIAKRLEELIDPWDRDYKTAEEMEADIEVDPAAVINYLIDFIEG